MSNERHNTSNVIELRAELARMEINYSQMAKHFTDAWNYKDFAKREVLSLRVALVNSATEISDMRDIIHALNYQVEALHETLAL